MAWIIRVLKGAAIGVGAILPGISGGVLGVVLGVYEPMLAFFAHPFTELRKRFFFFLPILIGFGLGVLGLSRVVVLIFESSATAATWLFIGLIAGALPALVKEVGRDGRPKSAYAALAVGFFVMLAVFVGLRFAGKSEVEPSFVWWAVCGLLWGLGLIVPGMSPSAVFLFLGLYEPMSRAIADLDFSVLVPMGLGFVATVLALSRLVDNLLKRGYSIVMHAVLGFVVASTASVVPVGEAFTWLCAGAAALGFAVSFGLSRLPGAK